MGFPFERKTLFHLLTPEKNRQTREGRRRLKKKIEPENIHEAVPAKNAPALVSNIGRLCIVAGGCRHNPGFFTVRFGIHRPEPQEMNHGGQRPQVQTNK